MEGLTLERVRSRIAFADDPTDALDRLAEIDPVPGRFALPAPDVAREILGSLDVAADAIEDFVSGMPSAGSDPEAWWVLERLYHELVAPDGSEPLWWPWPTPTADPLTRFFHLYVFVAAVPHARRLHAERGIDDEISWGTLRDITLQVENFRKQHGRPGLNTAFWLSQHFRGGIYLLGRLQFNLWKVVFDPGDGSGFKEGDPALGVHIPALGPLTPAACDDSFEQARNFFPRHFPEHQVRVATCGSWLLDDQLVEYLPESSNIIQFQRRFTSAPNWHLPGDDDVIRFVFGYVPPSLDDLPQETTLQRAAVEHIRSGRHWKIRNGWVEL